MSLLDERGGFRDASRRGTKIVFPLIGLWVRAWRSGMWVNMMRRLCAWGSSKEKNNEAEQPSDQNRPGPQRQA